MAKRGRNFNDFEKNFLVDLVCEFKHIIENTMTDKISVKEKLAAWE